MALVLPNNKKFAFTIIDDTDNGTVENTKPVYDYLYEKGIITTKTVWVYPSRDKFTGGFLQDEDYLKFILNLKDNGYEIALHNVGSGSFSRKEIIEGIEIFNKLIGYYPKMQINHASNPDNIYWGIERYNSIVKLIVKILFGDKRSYYGNKENSDYFWGDFCKDKIKYIRNLIFNDINTYKLDKKMPYLVKNKSIYSNYWFSSSDAHTVEEFNHLVNPKNIDQLVRENGICIVYTHFASGFVDKNGLLDPVFKKNVDYLSNRTGWFVPASTLLDYLKVQQEGEYVSSFYLNKLEIKWLIDRIVKKIRFRR